MPYSKVRNAIAGLDRLAQTIAVPHDHAPIRLPTFPNLERTGVLQFMQTDTISTSGGTEGAVVLVRSPTYPLWAKQLPSATTFMSYAVATLYNTIEVGLAAQAYPLPPLRYGAPSGSVQAWLDKWVFGIDSADRALVYIPPYATACVSLTVSGIVATNVELDCLFYASNQISADIVEPVGVTLVASNGKDFASANISGGFLVPLTVRYTAAPTVAGTIAALLVGYASGGTFGAPSGSIGQPTMLPLFKPAEFTNSIVPYRSTRCIAASVLLSNATRTLEKEGTVLAARLSSRHYGFVEATGNRTAVYSAHPKERYYGLLEKGIYAFTLPDAESEKFGDHVIVNNDGNLFQPAIRIDSLGYFSSILIQDLDGSASTTLAVTLDYHIEFRTSSMLFPLGFASTSLESYHGAQMALAQLGTFFENPLHLGAIAALVKAAVSKALPVVAPYAIGAAKSLGTLALDAAIKKFKPQTQATLVVPRPPPRPKMPAARKAKAKTSAKRKK